MSANLEEQNRVWSAVKGIVVAAIRSRTTVIIEGVYVTPKRISDLLAESHEVRHLILPVFFGSSEISIEEKTTEIETYSPEGKWIWKPKMDRTVIAQQVLQISRSTKTECEELGFPYYETNIDWPQPFYAALVGLGLEN